MTRSQDSQTSTAAPDRLILEGQAIAHTNFWISPRLTPEKLKAEQDQLEPTGVKFRAVLRAVNEGGQVNVSGNDLIVSNANAATLLLVAGTNYRGGDPAQICAQYLLRAARSYSAIKTRHLADHQKLFRRVDLEMAPPANEASIESLPIDERLARVRKGQDDPGLAALYFQFGRYLLMGSSRPGTMAANLQGIWNESMAPPWDSKYTTNINVEMNYWPAEVGNLPETTLPFFDLVKSSLEVGAVLPGKCTAPAALCFTTILMPGATRRRSITAMSASGRWAVRGWRSISGNITNMVWTAHSSAAKRTPS